MNYSISKYKKKGDHPNGRLFSAFPVKYVVFTLVLLVTFPCKSTADFTANSLIKHLTGIPMLSDYMSSARSKQEHPSELTGDIKRYVTFAGNRQSVFRNFTGPKKRIGHGLISVGINHPIINNTTGIFLSYTGSSSTITWPFSENRIRVGESHNDQSIAVTGYTQTFGRIRTGMTVGKHTGNSGSERLFVAEISALVSKRMKGSVRYYFLPYEWNIGIDYDVISKILPASFRHEGIEGTVSYDLSERINISATGEKSGINTPRDFYGNREGHAQKWWADQHRWNIRGVSRLIDGTVLTSSYGEDVISGNLGLFYDSSRYMKGNIKGLTRRFQLGGQFINCRRFVPSIMYNRVSTELLLSDGIADSWPFTPKQVEIIGDKTWTFSGTGIITSDSGTFLWNVSSVSRLTFSYIRAHFDYRLRITTRDHLSTNLFDMLFGRRRTETDMTEYYDFGNIGYVSNFTFGRLTLEIGISQFIPIFHKKKDAPGKAAEPPSFPELKLKKPENFGGFSFEAVGKWAF